MGGGTPTVMPAEPLRRILTSVPGAGAPDVEFTVEANPSSADELKLELLREAGVNRVSFGAQSFHPADLAVLDRLHDPAHIPEAVSLARRAGFDNINLDLIFGVPGQTLDRWLDSLRRAIDLGVEHIACYSLMYEEGTALTRQRQLNLITPCDEESEAAMFEQTADLLTAAGYEHYEVSNFARPGRHCRHNLIYWRNEEYVGVGPSAVSYVDGVRSKNVADVRRYVLTELARATTPVETESLQGEAHARETAVQLLRLTAGIGVREFRAETGYDPLELFAGPISRFVRSGHLSADGGRIRLTRRGLLVANRVMAEFV